MNGTVWTIVGILVILALVIWLVSVLAQNESNPGCPRVFVFEDAWVGNQSPKGATLGRGMSLWLLWAIAVMTAAVVIILIIWRA